MKRNILIFGLITGTLLCINMIIMINVMYNATEFKGNDVLGYAAMVAQFSLIFFGVRNYRNKYLDGHISFWEGFKTGALIAFVGSTLYVIVGLLCYYVFVPDFLDVYISHVLNNTPESELAAKTQEMADFKEMYKNPLFVVLITYFEVLPVGLIVALVSSLFLKKNQS